MSVPGLGGGGGLPAGADQLAGDGDRDYAGWLAAAFAPKLPAVVQPALDAPRVVDERGVLAALADREFAADRRGEAVVKRGLDQQPAGVGGPGLGDLAQPAGLAGAVLRRDQADEFRDRVAMLEAVPVADLRAQPERGQRVDATQTSAAARSSRPTRRS